MIRILLILFCLLFSLLAEATTYIPLALDRQLDDADSVIHGIYKGNSYKKLKDGEVVTELLFEVNHSAGIRPNEILAPKNFKVMIPGGVWQGVVYHVYGGPIFQEEEEVVLMLKKSADGFFLSNLALGKYQVFTQDGQKYLRSAVFPDHHSLGRIQWEMFDRQLNSIFGAGFTNTFGDKVVAVERSDRYQTTRGPASLESEQNRQQRSSSPFWAIVVLGLLGASSAYFIKRRGEDC